MAAGTDLPGSNQAGPSNHSGFGFATSSQHSGCSPLRLAAETGLPGRDRAEQGRDRAERIRLSSAAIADRLLIAGLRRT